MRIPRLYQSIPLIPQQFIELDEKTSHYLLNVMRAKVGYNLNIFNDQDEYSAVIHQIHKKRIIVEIFNLIQRQTESQIQICLAQSMARGEKMDFIIQKAVELGVQTIVPLFTERSNVRLSKERAKNRLSHWRSIVISACEQSGRNHIPEILQPVSLREWLPQAQANRAFVLFPHAHTIMTEERLKPGASVICLIGPEGGLSDGEIHFAKEQGFLPLSLGPRILRVETAAIAVLSILQFHFGDMS